jgi:hypothetical protein
MKVAKPNNLGSALPNDEGFPKDIGTPLEKAAESLKYLAGTIQAGETKDAITRAAKLAGLGYWRAFDLWYGKARRVEQFELDQIGDAVARKGREDDRRELHELQIRLVRLEARLAAGDASFHRPFLDGMGQASKARR